MKRSFSEKDTEETAEDEEKHLSMKRCVISDISLCTMAELALPDLAVPA
jgi:hypothetical protein